MKKFPSICFLVGFLVVLFGGGNPCCGHVLRQDNPWVRKFLYLLTHVIQICLMQNVCKNCIQYLLINNYPFCICRWLWLVDLPLCNQLLKEFDRFPIQSNHKLYQKFPQPPTLLSVEWCLNQFLIAVKSSMEPFTSLKLGWGWTDRMFFIMSGFIKVWEEIRWS